MTDKALIQSQRPLSPHLGIYRWQISNTLSILHRATGIALFAGSLLLAAWLWCAAFAPEAHALIHGFFQSWPGKFMLLGWSIAFYYHLAAGIRHLFWDIGKGFAVPVMNKTGWMVIAFTALATAGSWAYLYIRTGAL